MPSGYIGAAAAAGGGSLTDQYPGAPLADQVITATSLRTTIAMTASGTPHANGTYVEIDPSLSADASGMYVQVVTNISSNAVITSTLVEFGTGAGGAETLMATIGVGWRLQHHGYFVPGFIAAGTRVACRLRSAIASQTCSVIVSFLSVKSVVPAASTTYGADTAASKGINLTVPAGANAKGAWTQLAASTAADMSLLLVTPQCAGDSNMANGGILIDIGIGAGGAQTVLIPDIFCEATSSEALNVRSPMTYGVTVPAGSDLWGRYAASSTNNSIDLILVGA